LRAGLPGPDARAFAERECRKRREEVLQFPIGFHYIDGRLHCDGVPADEIAERFGTPCYVYSAGTLCERYRRISEAFSAWDTLVCFSVKSLANLSVLALLSEQGSGFDVVSGGELHRVLEAGQDRLCRRGQDRP